MSLPFKFPLLFLKMIFNPFKWEILLKYFYLNKIEKINILQRYSIHKRLRLFMMKVSGEVYSLNFNCRILFNKNNLILLNLSQERSFHILNNKDFSFENNVLVLSDDYFKKQKIFRFFRKVKI